jgi:hypothetical protein
MVMTRSQPADGVSQPHRQLCRLLAALFAGEASPDGLPAILYSPIVLVAADAAAGSLLLGDAVRVGRRDNDDRDLLSWDGDTLSREIAAAADGERLHRLQDRMATARLVLVDGIDRLDKREIQRSFATLFDGAAAAGTAFCMTIGTTPAQADLDPALASRLSGGLVVPLARRPVGHAAAPATAGARPYDRHARGADHPGAARHGTSPAGRHRSARRSHHRLITRRPARRVDSVSIRRWFWLASRSDTATDAVVARINQATGRNPAAGWRSCHGWPPAYHGRCQTVAVRLLT